jgi:hypothetical protein
LNFLSFIIVQPKYTNSILQIFKSNLPVIINNLILHFDSIIKGEFTLEEKNQLVTICLSKVVIYFPNLLFFLNIHLEKKKTIFFENNEEEFKKMDKTKILELLKASFRILSCFGKNFEGKFQATPFLEIYQNINNDEVKFKIN